VIGNKSTIRVVPASIPKMEQKLLCATFLEAVLRFYENPENMAAFEKWRMGKGGSTDDKQAS